MIEFRLVPHDIRKVQLVEVWSGDQFLATITPQEWGIRIVSKHLNQGSAWLEDIQLVEGEGVKIPPSLNVRLP